MARQTGSWTYHYIVSVADPAAQRLVHPTQLYPVPPTAVHCSLLEERTGEEDHHQEHRACSIEKGHRPHAEQLEDVPDRHIVLMEHIDGENSADDGGERYCPSSGAYGRGCIARERGRGPRRRRQVEGDYVDEHIGSLQTGALA